MWVCVVAALLCLNALCVYSVRIHRSFGLCIVGGAAQGARRETEKIGAEEKVRFECLCVVVYLWRQAACVLIML